MLINSHGKFMVTNVLYGSFVFKRLNVDLSTLVTESELYRWSSYFFNCFNPHFGHLTDLSSERLPYLFVIE
jgi:hypothetical protein